MVHATSSSPRLDQLKEQLWNSEGQTTMAQRFQALFDLRTLGHLEAIDIISGAFNDSSVLLKHELAYVLGQIKNIRAIPKLNQILMNENEDVMVRHEAAEALGAIGAEESMKILKEYLNDEHVEIRETCELALNRIELNRLETIKENKQYASIDPAPPLKTKMTIYHLTNMMLDTSLPLFERYRAMFSLRDQNDDESVMALAEGFKDSSALLRHEIAYIFGQLQHPASIPSLKERLLDYHEAPMVRHEAAEALGSIGTEECRTILEYFKQDSERVVQESALVAIDMINENEFAEQL